MAYYVNGTLISGANTLPKMTMAEYLALPSDQRPTYWECTDKDYEDISAENVSYGDGNVENYLNNLAANQVSYGSGSVKDALDHVSNIYVTRIKNSGSVGSVTFNIPNVPSIGYIAIVGDGNTSAVFSIIPIHSDTVRTERITHLTSVTFTATFSDGVLTITGGGWWGIQAIANFPIS